MITKAAARRYYLHRQLKKVMRIDVYGRTLFYKEESLYSLNVNQLRYFLELQLKFKYSAQQEMI